MISMRTLNCCANSDLADGTSSTSQMFNGWFPYQRRLTWASVSFIWPTAMTTSPWPFSNCLGVNLPVQVVLILASLHVWLSGRPQPSAWRAARRASPIAATIFCFPFLDLLDGNPGSPLEGHYAITWWRTIIAWRFHRTRLPHSDILRT